MFALKRSIAGLLAGAAVLTAFTASASPLERLGWIIVTADAPSREPIYLGGTNQYEEWGNDVTPDDGWNNNPWAPDVCDVLASQGRPQDCDRAVASGILAPPDMPTFPSFSAHNGQLAPNTSIMYMLWPTYSYVNYGLVRCYQNPSTNPDNCESEYISEFRDNCEALPTRDSLTFESNFNPREACLAAVDLAETRVGNAEFDRTLADWFGLKLGYQLGPFAVEINHNIFTSALLFNPYNRALIYARQYDACSSWYRVFDARNCGAQYQGV